MTNQSPLNPDDEARLKMALEQSANGQVVSRGSFAQPPLNELGIERAQDAYGDAILNRWWPRKTVIRIIRAYLSAQPVVNSVEELDALPVGSVILDGDPCVLQMVEKSSIVGSEWAIANEEHIYTTGKITLPARVLYRPTKESTNGR